MKKQKIIVNLFYEENPNALILEIDKNDYRKLIKLLNDYKKGDKEYNLMDFLLYLDNHKFSYKNIVIEKEVYF